MTEDEVRKAVLEALRHVAPDVVGAALDPNADLREAADIDSVDFLNLLIAIGEATGVEIPDRDAGRLTSVNALVSYVAGRG